MQAIDYVGVNEKDSARSKAIEVLKNVPGASKISHVWGYDPNVSNTEHHSGLAVDFMLYAGGKVDTALGNRIYNYLWTNRARLGVRHIIWQQSITSTVVDAGVRRPMADRGNDTANHRDHVHVLFFDVPYRPIETKPIIKAWPGTNYRIGSKNANVGWIQKRLNALIHAGLKVDNIYGAKTYAAVVRYQKLHKALADDGIVGRMTWTSLAVRRPL